VDERDPDGDGFWLTENRDLFLIPQLKHSYNVGEDFNHSANKKN
jgi:hypothetical protein